jgi:hypothetical protein
MYFFSGMARIASFVIRLLLIPAMLASAAGRAPAVKHQDTHAAAPDHRAAMGREVVGIH